MLARRSVLAVLGGGVLVAATGLAASATPAAAAPDAPRTVADVRRGLAGSAAEAPREMQYYIIRRRYWVRRYYVRRRRFVWRCWWNGYGRYCRWRYV
jgi:hypothetical protein